MKINRTIYKNNPKDYGSPGYWQFQIDRAEGASTAEVSLSSTHTAGTKLLTRKDLQEMHVIIIEALQDWRE